MPATKGTVTFIALMLLPLINKAYPIWVPFFCMFVLAQTVALAFTSPDRLRTDEEVSRLRARIWQMKSSIIGAVIAKTISIALAFFLGWLISDWWFAILVLLGFILISGKGITALLMIQSDKGEFANLDEAQREAKLKEWAPVVAKGRLGYAVGCSAFGVILFQYGGLEPGNWMGWSGLLGGAIVNAALSRV